MTDVATLAYVGRSRYLNRPRSGTVPTDDSLFVWMFHQGTRKFRDITVRDESGEVVGWLRTNPETGERKWWADHTVNQSVKWSPRDTDPSLP